MQTLLILPETSARLCRYCMESAVFNVKCRNAGYRGGEEIAMPLCGDHAVGMVTDELVAHCRQRGRSVRATSAG